MGIYSNQIDFLVIGAAKSGTTSLYRLLSRHTDIYIPAAKELSFFNSSQYYKGKNFYLETWFSGATQKIWGDCSPQYFFDPITPKRIHNLFPQTKFILILRNPIDRLISHFDHAKRLDLFEGTLDEEIAAILKQKSIEYYLNMSSPKGFEQLIRYSQYGLIMQSYLKYFTLDRFFILFYDEFISQPEVCIKDICTWLGVNEIQINKTDTKKNKGGIVRYKFLNKLLQQIHTNKPIMRLVKLALSPNRRLQILHYIKNELNVKKAPKSKLSQENHELLIELFRPDTELLKLAICKEIPWAEFHS